MRTIINSKGPIAQESPKGFNNKIKNSKFVD